ncbi:Hsp20 family protein [Lacticaseibacillus mingshuiensis]|uniref:Hsp20 family protein n=2 Tax=Lacticaseibacillus mingshuiensis TaxID=2799574 RepID=A0ABW4CJC6_9LACO|nr:Hsp20 family protein [Lacticaseibacillus mingshuiensis]
MANELMNSGRWLADPMFDELSRRFFDRFAPAVDDDHLLRTDIRETAQAYVATVDVPGVKKDAIDLRYQDEILTITVHEDSADESQASGVLLSERQHTQAQRQFKLPDVDAAKISATTQDGVLTITLPKAAEVRTHDITID